MEFFVDRFGRFIRRDVPLAGFTTLGIGGPAELLAEVDSIEDFTALVGAASLAKVSITILGEGSNLLIGDGGLAGLVVINRCCRIWEVESEVLAEAGAKLNDLVDFTVDHGLAGLEKMAGIPGTVGGAVIGNAGAYGQSISAGLSRVTLLGETGAVFDQEPVELDFGYRTSRLKSSTDIVLRTAFRLPSGSATQLRKSADEVLAQRAAKLPTDDKSAGSYFKNIEDSAMLHGKMPAGKLLEEAGVKSFRVGQAAVSDKHANVIVNLGGATAAEVRQLADQMKSAVKAKFGIELEEEVRFLGKP
ncbi:UDP-N-acetylmuramate dehydrogenase [Candidatus Zixiibacteriota bacterium]